MENENNRKEIHGNVIATDWQVVQDGNGKYKITRPTTDGGEEVCIDSHGKPIYFQFKDIAEDVADWLNNTKED